MNKTFLLFFTVCCLIGGMETALGQLSGTFYVGAGGDYATFADAITALNTNGVGPGGVVFLIKSGTYAESAPLLIDFATNKPTSSNPVLFKPEPSAIVVLNVGGQVTGSRWALKIGSATNSIDYVTLDGSNATGGTTRDWTIKATATTYGIEPLDIYGDYVTVKNCVVDMISAGYSGSGYGISFRDAVPTATFGTVENCKVTGNNAISIGRGTTNDMPGFYIKNNETHSLNRGIYLYRSSAATIEGNEIIGDAYAGYPAGACYGIYTASPSGNTGTIVIRNNVVRNLGVNTGTASAQTVRGINAAGPGFYEIYGNKIYNLLNATSGSGNPIVYGIQLSGGGSTSDYKVYNNAVCGLSNNDPDANATTFTYGIQYNTSGNALICHNSVFLEETTRDHLSACLQITAGNALNTISAMDNVFYNSNTSATYKSYSVYKSSTLQSVLTSNYNLLYSDGATNAFVGFDGTTDHATLADWINNTAQDANSKSKAVTFVSATDLHLDLPSIGDTDLAGIAIPSVTTDIDGEARPGNAPYMGADEIPGSPLPVQLASFIARVDPLSNSTVLHWTTASEINNYGFYVQRKSENGEFADLSNSFVAGHGTTNEPQSYSWTDLSVTRGTWYYRLKQVDLDHSVHYSDPISVTIVTGVQETTPQVFSLSQNYPNPFNPSTTIRFEIAKPEVVTLKVYDVLGREIATLANEQMSAGNYSISFNASNLASGTYVYRLQAGSFVSTKMMNLTK